MLPAVPGKVHAVIGMRRAGKTTFLRQLLAEHRAVLPHERALYLSFDDDRLAGLGVDQLGFLLEEYYRRNPSLRGQTTVHWLLDEIQLVPGWERSCAACWTRAGEIAVSDRRTDALARSPYVDAWPWNGDRHSAVQLPRVPAPPTGGADE
jgi:hypothetical protein